jgi:hypothetical protein
MAARSRGRNRFSTNQAPEASFPHRHTSRSCSDQMRTALTPIWLARCRGLKGPVRRGEGQDNDQPRRRRAISVSISPSTSRVVMASTVLPQGRPRLLRLKRSTKGSASPQGHLDAGQQVQQVHEVFSTFAQGQPGARATAATPRLIRRLSRSALLRGRLGLPDAGAVICLQGIQAVGHQADRLSLFGHVDGDRGRDDDAEFGGGISAPGGIVAGVEVQADGGFATRWPARSGVPATRPPGRWFSSPCASEGSPG